jgi:acetylornithine deacetylase
MTHMHRQTRIPHLATFCQHLSSATIHPMNETDTASTDALAESLLDWLAIDSTTGREAEFLEHLEAMFQSRGWSIRRQPVAEDRWNLVATATDDPSLLYSTHVDTVPPHLAARRDGETVYGRGACDTKGGLLAMTEAARRLRADGHDDLGFLLVVGEEVDHIGAKTARDLDLHPDRIVLCEPTQNRVVTGQKGMVKAELSAEGKAAHSAYPDRGISAVHRLLDALQRIRSVDWPTDPVLGDTTLNVGEINGGVAANVMAPSADAVLLFRAVSPADALIERLEDAAGEHVHVEIVAHNDPVRFDVPEDVDTCTVAFNTDASYLQTLGSVWLVGPGDIQVAHSEDERIDLRELQEGIQLYADLGRTALEGS